MTLVPNITDWEFSSCHTLYNGKVFIREQLINVLVVLMALSTIVNFSANIAVMNSMSATNQLKTTSLKILFSLSASDVCLSVIGQPLFLMMLSTSGDKLSCIFDISVEVSVLLFGHISAWIIVLIGFDRFFRIKYTKSYTSRVKDKYFYTAMALLITVSIIQVTSLALGTYFQFYSISSMISTSLDMIMFGLLFLPYVMTVFTVKRRVRMSVNKRVFDKTNKLVSAMGKRIIVAIFVMYAPYAAFTMMRVVLTSFWADVHGILDSEWFNFCLLLSCELAICNSVVNALIFFSLNKRGRRMLFSIFFKKDKSSIGETISPGRHRSSITDAVVRYRADTRTRRIEIPIR